MVITNPLAKIDFGKDKNFFKKLVVNSLTFQDNCDIFIPFPTQVVTFNLEGAGSVQYSFNGNIMHGDMTSGQRSANLKFENRVVSKIWFQGSGTVRIEAWCTR